MNTIYEKYSKAAKQIVQKMSLDEKIGQMLLPATNALTINYAPGGVKGAQAAWGSSGTPPEPSKTLGDALGFQAIADYQLGGVLQAGGPVLYSGNDPVDQRMDQWQAMTATVKLYEKDGLPLLLGNDGIHGNQHVVGTILFPHNIGLGATHNPILAGQVAAWSAYDIAMSGFNWTFMPTVAMGQDYRWGRFYECYSSNGDVVEALAQSYIEGIQGISDGKINGVLACVKHFIGDGATENGEDEGASFGDDLHSFWHKNGAGYQGAVRAQVASAMASYNSLNDIPMHFGGDFDALNQFRNVGIEYDGQKYKLEGFVVSDYDGIARAAWKHNILHNQVLKLPEAMAMSINAGVDVIMMSSAAYTNPFDPGTYVPPNFQNKSPPYYTNLQDVVTAIKSALDTGLLAIEKLDDVVFRIIRTKLAMNLAPPSAPKIPEHSVSLNAAQQSLVILKNEKATIPLAPEKTEFVFLMGDYDDIGIQNGGWTFNWQGQKGNDYWSGQDRATAHATSIIDGVKLNTKAQIILGDSPFTIPNGVNANNSVAIIAISEFPYAEFMGDVANQNPWYSQGAAQGDNTYAPAQQNTFLGVKFTDAQMQAINNLKKAGVPIVTVLFSGRPLVITEGPNAPLPNTDSFIAAFLPGTSGGEAIANVLFGKFATKSISNEIRGNRYQCNTLPFAWPASMQEVIHHTPSLFPEGYGQ